MEKIGPALVALLTSYLDESETYLDSTHLAPVDVVHQCRRNGKRVIALLELLRPSLGEPLFRQLHEEMRNGNRVLAEPRRAAVLLTTLRKVGVAPATTAELERELKTQCTPEPEVVEQAIRSVRSLRSSLAAWPCEDVDPDTVRHQFKLSRELLRYRRKRTRKKPSPKRLHSLRKRLRRVAVQWATLEHLGLSRKQRIPKKHSKFDAQLGKVNDLHDLEQLVGGQSESDIARTLAHREELLRNITKLRKRKTRSLVSTHLH